MGVTVTGQARRWIAAAIGGAMLTGIGAVAPAWADRNGFYVRNRAEVSMTAVYVSPIFSKLWRDDRLPDGVLAPGGETWVPIDDVERDSDCFFDVRIETAGGEPYEFWGVDLCTTKSLSVP